MHCETYEFHPEVLERGASTSSTGGPLFIIEICTEEYISEGGGNEYNIGDPGPLAFPTGGGGGNPGGIEDLPNVPVCPAEARSATTNFVISPCGLPWIPVLSPSGPTNPYNPYNADTVGYTNGLKNVYPCAYNFIKDSLINSNLLAQLAAGEVFKDSAHMHLTFDTSTTYTTVNGATAVTIGSNTIVNSDGITEHWATIKLNGWYLRHATKESMIATIIHEIMHAVFTMRWEQYEKWRLFGPPNEIDSVWMKARYPYFWQNYVVNGIPTGTEVDHEIMATDYYNMFKSAVQYYWNPATPQAIKDSTIKALCYGGLLETTAWKLLGQHGIDTCRYKAIIVACDEAKTGSYAPYGCGTYSIHYADSLKLRSSCN